MTRIWPPHRDRGTQCRRARRSSRVRWARTSSSTIRLAPPSSHRALKLAADALGSSARRVEERAFDLRRHAVLILPGLRGRGRSLSENTFNAALRRLGYTKDEMTAHGFRAAASSMLNESGKWNADAIEAQLAHVEGNLVRRAYARAEFWDERVRMTQWWADRLDELRRGGEVIPLSSGRQHG